MRRCINLSMCAVGSVKGEKEKVRQEQEKLRKQVKIAKALNDEWSYKQMSEVIEITPHAFYNWLHGYYELSSRKLMELDSLISDLLEE